jgi:hypothetical protein
MANRGATLLALATPTRLFIVPLAAGSSSPGSSGAAKEGAAAAAADTAPPAAPARQAVVLWPPTGWSSHPNNCISALQWSPDGRKLLVLLDNWQPFPEVGRQQG